MRLYSWDIAPNPRRVRIYLAEKGIDVPIEDVGLPGKPVLRPDFLERFSHLRRWHGAVSPRPSAAA